MKVEGSFELYLVYVTTCSPRNTCRGDQIYSSTLVFIEIETDSRGSEVVWCCLLPSKESRITGFCLIYREGCVVRFRLKTFGITLRGRMSTILYTHQTPPTTLQMHSNCELSNLSEI